MRSSSRLLRLSLAAAITLLIMVSWFIGRSTTSAQSDTAPEQPSGLSTEAGDTQVRLSWEDPDDSTIDKYELWQIAESATLTAANNEFGYSVAVAGDIAVIGMPDDDESGLDSGAALVFSRVDGVWTQKYRLRTGDDAGVVKDDGFGSSIAFDGETIVVGAPFDDSKKGAAYLFVKPGDGWDNPNGTDPVDLTDPAKLTAPNAAVEDEFGYSVAMDGNTVVVGAYSDDSTDTDGNTVANSGSAYVFTKPGNAWVSTSTAATLTASDAAAGDEFGSSVAVDGNTIVVGASGDDGDALEFTGSAFVFVKPNGGWVSTSTAAKLIAYTRGNQDYFGRSVAIDGDTIVVGADGQESNKGSAFVFAEPSGGWVNNTETAKLTASVRSGGHRFGFSVALDGDTVVVGAYGEASSRGSAYAFTMPGTGWATGTETAQLTASDAADNDRFGSSVAIDGDTVVVGAQNNDTAYVFDIDDWADIAGSNAATTSHIVTGLTNDIDHTFRVRAVDGTEASDPSDSVAGTPKAASYAPVKLLNFSAAQTGDGEVEMTWDAHRYPLTVSGYEYNQDGGDWNAITGSDSSTHSHTVTGLTKGTTYTFAVRAVNGAGSTESDSRSVTIIGQPAAPDSFTAVAGDEQVWLGWRSPADFTISGYEYRQKEGTGDFDVWQKIPGSRSGTTFHIVTGLSNDTSYTFQVRAANAAGESDASREQPATPGAASPAPGVPEGFAARQTGVGHVELTWVASSNPLNVNGYEFRQDNGSWTTISGSDSRTVSHSVTGLTQGVTYTFRVRAKNSAGNGASSGAESVIVVAEPAAPTDLAAEAGDTQVGLTWKDPGNASIAKYQIFQFPEGVTKLISNDRDDDDEFGWSVAVDGDTLVIGAIGADEPNNTGAAYVFTRVAGGWTQVGKLTAAVRGNDAGFGHGVAVHGDTIVVGAYEENHSATTTDAGAAYVFTRPAAGWATSTSTAKLTASDAVANDEFGSSVAVHEDTIVVGAPEQTTPANGAAYIFTKPANGWADGTETAKLAGQSNGDRFGRSVAVHGDTVVVGAHEEGANNQGEAYVFTKSAATGVWDDWDKKKANDATARLTASDRASGDRFGRAVAMDGDTIVIGAPYHDYDDPDDNTNDVSDSGAAYVFIKTASSGWVSTSTAAKLTASDGAENDQFGYSVAVDGNTVVVGADLTNHIDGDGNTVNDSGSAYVFTEPQGGWTDTEGTDPLTAYDRHQNDRFGNFVAVDGDTVLVGAVGDNSAKGSAYVFGTGEWADIPGSGAGTISHIARGLRNNVKHTFRVRAVNAAGAGDASEADAKAVAATFGPSQPANLTVTQTGVGQVRLAWTASTEPLTVRRYQYKQNDGSGFGNWIIIEGSDSSTASHTITGLIAGIEYSFTVGTVNGGGQNASDVESVTLEAQAAAPSNLDADVGDEQVKLIWDDPGDSTIDKYQHFQIDPSKLTAGDGLRGDLFGYSVAVDGNTAVIGAYQNDHTDDDGNTIGNAGSAYVFTKVSGVWRQLAKLTASDGDTSDEFGYSVAVDGDTIVVGAHLDDHTDGDGDTDDDEGAAYVFTKPANGWADMTQTAKLTAFGAAAGDEFGISVAVDGDTILVGAHQNDSNKGAAYVFTKFGGVWGNAPVSGDHRVETAKLIAADGAANDEFGISVALDGDTAVIGAYHDDHTDDGNTIGNAGSAYVFTRVSGVWSQKAKLIASDGAANDEFGISVAVNGDTVVVGARQDDTSDGAAYLFTEVSGVWKHVAKLTADDGVANDEFGISVAVDGDTILVGAYQDDDNGDLSGSAYVFTRDSAGGWRQRDKLTASDGAASDRYGYSVGVSDDTVVVGAYSDDSNEANTGAAYFLRIPGWTDIPDSAATTTSHIVTGLSNYVEHTFQVRGVNAAGGGLASDRAGGTPTFAIPDLPEGLTADAGDAVVDLTWVDPEDSTIEKYQLLQIIQGGKLTTASTDDPVVRGDGFGISVAVDGNTAVVGAYRDDDDGANSGSAHVFTRSSSTDPWSWAAKLTADDAAANDEFGISVAVHGDTIVVGAHQVDDATNGDNSGSAYVFTKVSGIWGQKAKLTASDATADDAFGISVAVHDETVVVGAHLENANDDDVDLTDDVTDSGAAYVFTKPGSGGWADATETAKLTASDGAVDDEFGISMAVHGETVVVGAHQDDDATNGDNSGSAYVFDEPSGGWADATETAKLTALDAAENDAFGISVAVHGDTVVVGAHKYDVDDNGTSIPNAGAAYVFTKPETDANDDDSEDWKDWGSLDDGGKAGLTAKLIASDAARGDEFGISVAVDDDEETIVVGAYLDDDTGDNSGSAYVFTQDANSGKWSHTAKLTGPSRGRDNWVGHSVAVVGNTVIAGADKSNISGPDSGAVYLWTVPGWTDIANSDATTTSHTVTDLTNRVEYSLQVRAVDKVEGAGASPPSDVRATPLKPRPAKPTGLSAAPGDTQVKLSWNDPVEGSPPINNYELWQHAERPMLTDDDRAANDEFGYAVAIDGDTAVVGMPGEDNPDNSGAAFVFTRDSSGTWSQVAKLRASDPNAQDRIGLSVAVHEDTSNGDTIVVGAPHHSSSKGAVYVFTEPSGGWASTSTAAKLTASDRADDDEFGISVAVDGDTVAVGAHNNNAAYVFTKPTDGWTSTTTAAKLSGSDSFGRSVAVDAGTIVVGASGDSDDDQGSAFVFTKPATGWADSTSAGAAKLTAYSRNNNDRFGRSVAIDGDTIVVGAHQPTYQDGGETIKQPGAAYVFTKPDTGWANSPGTETAKLTASDRTDGDQFGFSVAVDGDTIVIGADALNETNRSGSAYVFTKPAAGWADSTEAAKLTGSGTGNGDRFGLSVSVDGLTAMVGSNGQGSNSQGAAYLYDIAVWADIAGSTGETRSHFATGLTNGLEHTFAVRAVNDGGASVRSDQVSETPAAAPSPPLKPRNFSAVQTGAGEVRLEWERSVQPLAVTGYEYTSDGGSNWNNISGSDSGTVSYTVSGLMVGTRTFAVRATNSAGEGVSSDPWSVTIAAAPDRPTALTAVAGDEQVELSWRYSGGQTSTTGFQYQQKTEGDFGDDWTDVTGSTWTTRSHIVTGLTNDTTYTFRVRAVNVTIGSDTTNEEDATPSASGSRPARPTNFNAEQTGVGQVELTWDTAGARLTVTGYQYTADGGSNWSDISGSDSGANSHTVSGLTTGDTFTFAVRAVNSGALPGLSSVSRDVTIVGEPRLPTGLGATGGDTQATFHWNVTVETTDRPIDKHQLLHLPQSKLTDDDGADDDEFGYSVAIHGNTAVVGAYHRNLNGNANAGAAYVFTRPDGGWTTTTTTAAKLTASDGEEDDRFGHSVAVVGDTVVVGAYGDDGNRGAAYVFTRPDGGWTTTTTAAKLTASDGEEDDRFGHSVAVFGDTVVVGAYGDDGNRGAAYVFTKTGGAWTSTTTAAKLTASDGEANDEFGVSVAVDEDTVAVGAHLHDLDVDGASMLDAGAVYVFTKPAAGWTSSTESAKLTATDGAAGDEFGISVAIDENTVLVGAHQPDYVEEDETVSRPGSVYVFDRDPESGKWSQTAKLTASNGDGGDGFGNSVAVDGNTAVVGAYLDDRDDAARDTGSTYVFARKLGVWSQTLNLAGPGPDQNDWLGYSVAVDDGTLLAGAPQDDNDPGFAYAMEIAGAGWTDLVAEELTVSEEEYFYRVLGLTNDQEYAFRVRSVNAAANRPSDETVAATPRLHRPIKPTGLVADARDRAVELSWDLSDDSTISRYQVLQHPEQSRLTASDGADGDKFGSAVAVDGGTAVVGAPEHDGTGTGGNTITNSGAAYVFTRDTLSGEWSQPIKLTASDGKENDWFGYSVAVHENTVVIGAYLVDLNATTTDSGAAYVFTRPDGGWVATSTAAKLTDSDGKKNDWFGYSVAVHESAIVVGARGYDGKKGASYVFTKPAGGDWTSTSTSSKLIASDGAGFDYFGHSVAVHGDTIVIGAYRHKTNTIPTGAAYVFTRPVGGWVATSTAAKLSASNGDDGDQFGHSVAVDGDTVVIGAQQDDGDRGSAYVFTDAIEMARLAASDRGIGDYFGSSVAVRGSTILVGAYTADIDPSVDSEGDNHRSGAAYVFTQPTGAFWANDPNEDNRKESGKLTLPTEVGAVEKPDEFGHSVALDGQSIVVGAPAGNDGFGSVYVSDIPQWSFLASGAETTSATVGGLTNGVKYTFQVRAVDKVSDVGESPPSNIARATPLVRNHAPEFIDGESTTLAVDEKQSTGNPVGSAVTATDLEDDTLTYSLSGTHASSFDIDAFDGQIAVGSGATLDYESGLREYSVIVSVHDRLDTDGDQDTTNDDSIDVTINVNNVDEAGTVSMSTTWPREGTTLSASLTDPDGSVSDTSWQWARSANGSTGWRDIVRANSYRYRPVANDGGNYLRATASYTDGHGSGKEAAVVSTNRVRSLDRPETSPPPTPTPVPITVVPPGVGDATVPPGLLLVIGLIGMLLVIAGRIVVRERRSNRRL